MIKVEPGRTTVLGTGKNVNGTADTFLESGPKDELATVDAYKSNKGLVSEASNSVSNTTTSGGLTPEIKSSSFINSVKDGFSATTPSTEDDDSLSSLLWTTLLCGKDVSAPSLGSRKNKMFDTSLWLRSTGCSAENLLDLIKVENGQFSISQEELTSRLNSTMNGSISMLTEDDSLGLMESLGSATGTDSGVIKASVGEVSSFISGDRSGEVDSLSSMLNQIPGGNSLVELLDLTAEFVFLDMIIEKTIALGLPSLVKGLFDKIENDEVRTQVLRKRLRQSAYVSDLETVSEIIDRIGAGQAQADEPDLTNVITGNYRLGNRTRASDYPAKRAELLTTLNKFDPNWSTINRGGTVVSNLDPFITASKDAVTMFKGSPHEKNALIGSGYNKSHYTTVVKKYHPLAAGIGQTA